MFIYWPAETYTQGNPGGARHDTRGRCGAAGPWHSVGGVHQEESYVKAGEVGHRPEKLQGELDQREHQACVSNTQCVHGPRVQLVYSLFL